MDDPLQKGTSGYDNKDYRKIWMPIVKDVNCETGYMAVLSDDSLDREDEFMHKSALDDFVEHDDYLAGLMDHENKVLNQVCSWINRRVVDIEGHNAVIAEPKFFKSNPNAKVIMGMLDEGAQIGVSIGAIVKDYEDRKVGDKTLRGYKRLEPIEASFVAVPAQKHAHAIAISKSLKPKTNGGPPMDKTYSQVEVDELVKKHDAEKTELKRELVDSKTAIATEKDAIAKQLEAVTKERDELKNKATLMKGADVGTPGNAATPEQQVATAVKDGKVLVMSKSS